MVKMPISKIQKGSSTLRWGAGVAAMALLLVAVGRWRVVLAQSQPSYGAAQEQGPQGPPQAMDGGQDQSPAVDPPSRVARLSLIAGSVSVEPASVDQFSVAETNYPLTTGDRIFADTGATAELDAGGMAVRLGQKTDLTVTAMTDVLSQFGLGQGSVHLRTFHMDQGTTTELDTPNVAITVLQAGDVRVDVDPDGDATTVTVLSGQAQVDGNGLEQVLEPGQSMRMSGSNPVVAQWSRGGRADGLDRFSSDRDQMYQSAAANDVQYVNQDMIGAEDLNGQGTWEPDADYGPVWYPTAVAVGWQPYCFGHWTWIAPWGWTWVENEPWGFAPFHYGRWSRFGGRWGWIPGPPVLRPVYSPALVVFVGGAGVTAWFPLGPREPYHPWYHTSTLYQNRVNVTNIYNRNVAEVRNTYNQRSVNVFAERQGDNRVYRNRDGATIAVDRSNFAAGRPVAPARVDARQVQGAPVIPHPLVTPERSTVVNAPSRSVPVRIARPELASHEERPQAPPVRPSAGVVSQPAPVTRAPLGIPATGGPVRPQRPSGQPSGEQTPLRAGPPPNSQQPSAPTQFPTRQGPESQPSRPPQQVPQPTPGQPAPGQNDTQRPLFNRAVPPPPRPSFDEQQRAIQNSDPGRPLSPQQLNNLRQNQPAGQPVQRETPHPMPPPPARSTPPPPARSAPPPPARTPPPAPATPKKP